MVSHVHVALAALAWSRFALSNEDAQCFYPDGSKADADVPCFRNDSLSRVCCSPNQVCSTNGLCVNKEASSPAQTFRGSCLDPLYGPSCPTFCTALNKNQQSAVITCGDPKAGTFCCDEGGQAECCATPSKILTLGAGNLFPEGPAASSMLAISSTSNAPATTQSQPLITMQTNSIIYIPTPAPLQTQTPAFQSAQPAVDPPGQKPTVLPTRPFTPFESPKEGEVLRATSRGTPSSGATAEAAIIGGAESQPSTASPAPPLSAVAIASAASGSVIIFTLIMVVSIVMVRARLARKEQSVGNSHTKEVNATAKEKGHSRRASPSPGVKVRDEEMGKQMPGGNAPQRPDAEIIDIGSANGFIVTDRSREYPQATRLSAMETLKDPFQSEPPSPRFRNEGDWERDADPYTRELDRTSDPFNRRISLTPIENPFTDRNRHNEAVDSPTNVYYEERGWSPSTLATELLSDLPRGSPNRGVSRDLTSLNRDANRDRERMPPGSPGLNSPPRFGSSTGIMRPPAAGMERRVSRAGIGNGTLDSETFQRLMHDVSSRPF